MVTGFEPFGSHHSNPSWDAVEALLEEIEGVQIVKRKLPVSFRRFSAPLEAAIEEERPDGLICVGLAGGEDKVSVERVGINLMEARIPDNDGFQPFDTPICPDGDTAYFPRFLSSAWRRRWRAAGLPAVCPTRREPSCATRRCIRDFICPRADTVS